jgi:hypothetical protein
MEPDGDGALCRELGGGGARRRHTDLGKKKKKMIE